MTLLDRMVWPSSVMASYDCRNDEVRKITEHCEIMIWVCQMQWCSSRPRSHRSQNLSPYRTGLTFISGKPPVESGLNNQVVISTKTHTNTNFVTQLCTVNGLDFSIDWPTYSCLLFVCRSTTNDWIISDVQVQETSKTSFRWTNWLKWMKNVAVRTKLVTAHNLTDIIKSNGTVKLVCKPLFLSMSA